MSSPEPIKVVFTGESKVGKSSIQDLYINGKFNPEIQPSSTAQFFRKEVNLADKGNITLDIWDTSGATKYRNLAKIFLKDAKAALLVYDLTDENTFKELKDFWYSQVKDLNLTLAIVANKCDLSEKKVKDEEGKGFADSIGAIFAIVSAKENIGIQELFQKIAEAVKNKN